MTKKEKVQPFPMSMRPSDIEAIDEWIINNKKLMSRAKAVRILVRKGIDASNREIIDNEHF